MAKRWPGSAGFPGQRVDPFPSGFSMPVRRVMKPAARRDIQRPRNSIESKLEHEADLKRTTKAAAVLAGVRFGEHEVRFLGHIYVMGLPIKQPEEPTERPFLTSLTHPHVVAWLAARGGRTPSPEWTDAQRKVYETTKKRWQAHHWGHRSEKYAKLEGFNNRSARKLRP